MKTIVVAGGSGPFLKKGVPDDELDATVKRLKDQGFTVVETRDEEDRIYYRDHTRYWSSVH